MVAPSRRVPDRYQADRSGTILAGWQSTRQAVPGPVEDPFRTTKKAATMISMATSTPINVLEFIF